MVTALSYTVVVTRSHKQAPPLINKLQAAGFKTILSPALEIRPRAVDEEMRCLAAKIAQGAVDWLVFTSANGVMAFEDVLVECGARLPQRVKVAVLGTAAAARLRLSFARTPDLIAPVPVAESLLEALLAASGPADCLLLALASETRGVLESGLRAAGRRVEAATLYTTVPVSFSLQARERLGALPHDRLIFTFCSPSAVRSVAQSLGGNCDLLRRARCASIGAVTSRALRELGLEVFAEADEPSPAGMVRALSRRLGL